MNAFDIIKTLQKNNPTKKFATNPKANAIAYYNETLERWQILLGQLIGGEWDRMPELMVNNKPLIPQEDWIEAVKA